MGTITAAARGARHSRRDGHGARGELRPLQFFHRRGDVRSRDEVAVFIERRHHGRVAQRVDEARYAAGVAEEFREGVFGEDFATVRAGHIQAVPHIGTQVFARQRAEMETKTDALRELDQFRRVEFLVELGLSGENDAQHLLLGGLDAGQHPDFLEHLQREILCFVDDQQHLAARRILLDEEAVERRDQLGLLHLERREAELHQHRLKEFDCVDLGLVDLRDDHIRIELPQEAFDERGFARTDFACDHDEAICEPDGRLHVRLGARMGTGQVKELRVRAQPERQLAQFEVIEVHRSARYYGKAGVRAGKPLIGLPNCEPGRAVDPRQDLKSPPVADFCRAIANCDMA